MSGVFVKREHRKQELGLEFTRVLLLTLQVANASLQLVLAS